METDTREKGLESRRVCRRSRPPASGAGDRRFKSGHPDLILKGLTANVSWISEAVAELICRAAAYRPLFEVHHALRPALRDQESNLAGSLPRRRSAPGRGSNPVTHYLPHHEFLARCASSRKRPLLRVSGPLIPAIIHKFAARIRRIDATEESPPSDDDKMNNLEESTDLVTCPGRTGLGQGGCPVRRNEAP